MMVKIFLFIVLLSFEVQSEEHCNEYVIAYNSDDIKNVFDSFMNGIHDMPALIRSEYESRFLTLDVESKIKILEDVLKNCSVIQSDNYLKTVIEKEMQP
ncbi:hypothetical protein HWV00_17075 [Moritella sp. 24]|uniref:hypothetical protein n=1 Tax=Moritella sp. 24 TaxID=2746230 RepID=UPI001BA9FA9D|nr:hypothetical protein [Moritella sp. 24]QUM77797.1 hypothetical protein HWV00_17075 [Moritella sp. 24]